MNLKAKLLFGALFLGVLGAAEAELAWEKTQIELRPKAGDADAVAVFKYQNTGKTPVRITSVKSSCGCTVAASKKDDVAPGEKGEVTATFHIGGRTGEQQKTITVETDDTTQPVTSLLLKAVIEQSIEIQPSFVFWQASEDPKPKTMRVKLGKELAASKLEVASSNSAFSTRVEKGSAPGEFIVSVQPKDVAEARNTTLTIKADLPQPAYATARVLPPAPTGR